MDILTGLLANLGLGFQISSQPMNLLFCLIGAFLGTAVGVLPGVGPLATIAMLLPLTFKVSPEASIIMLAGIYYGAQYGGSTTAILINLPGEASSAITAIEGHQMAKRGRAGAALAIAALGSFFAGSIATLVVAVAAVPMTALALTFGPVEYFSLMLLGLVASIALANGSVPKALGMIMIGLLLGCVGTDIYTGTQRFTLGLDALADGMPIVAFGAGIYGLAEILRGLEGARTRQLAIQSVSGLMPTRAEFRQAAAPAARGTVIGSLLGVLPGGGPLLASFGSYSIEKRLSRTPGLFGKGHVPGVAGPEAANNAAAQTSFIPMLTLGIPSNPVMALMVGAMIIQGIQPGPEFISKQPNLFWGVIASMWIGNAMLVVLNLPMIGLWVKMLTVPERILFPAIIAFATIGAYSVSLSTVEVAILSIFGLCGYVLVKLKCEPAPLLLGFILGPMLEEYFRRSMIISLGDPSIFITKPISAGMLFAAGVLLVITVLPAVARKRQEVFIEE